MRQVHRVWFCGADVRVRTDWGNPSSPIQTEHLPGSWVSFHHLRVVDFPGGPRSALAAIMRAIVEAAGEDPDTATVRKEIATALEKINPRILPPLDLGTVRSPEYRDRAGAGAGPCLLCGNAIDMESDNVRWVRMDDGLGSIVDPVDPCQDGGCFPIGLGCYRRNRKALKPYLLEGGPR